jgi:hypothetical protein
MLMNATKVYKAAHHLHEVTLFLDYAYQKDLRLEKGPFKEGTHFDHITRNILALLYSYCEMAKLKDPVAEGMGANVRELVTSLDLYLKLVAEYEKIRMPEMTSTDGILATEPLVGYAWHDLLLDRVKGIIAYAEDTLPEFKASLNSTNNS